MRAELAEIDENLVRNELSVLERGEQLARRKEVYESLYPETKKDIRGGFAKAAKSASEIISLAPSFSQDTAAKTGQSDRTIQQEVQIASKIDEEVKDLIRDSDIADNKTELLALARLSPERQKEMQFSTRSELTLLMDYLELI